MSSLHPIPEAIPSLPPYRPLRQIQPVVAVARASLVIQRLQKSNTRLNLIISPRELENRTRFLLVRFRIHINRRYENSQKSGHLRKLCSSFLALNPPATKISRQLCLVVKEALSAAPHFPDYLKMSWWRVRNFLCKSTLKQKECPPLPPWPLPSKPAKLNEVRILFWNTNGNHLTEHKRTLLSQTSEELKLDVIALAEIKTTSTDPPIPTFNTCSFRRSLVGAQYSAGDIRSIAGGICVGKSPSPDVTARNTLVFDGFIEAVATTIKTSQLSFILVAAYLPPHSNSHLRGKFENKTFLKQLRGLYRDGTGNRQPLVMVADLNADMFTMTGKGAKTLRLLLREGWEIRNPPDTPTYLGSRNGSCIDVVLTRNLHYALSCSVIPMSATDHQALHVVVSAKTSRQTRPPDTCNKHAAKRFASALEDEENPFHSTATDVLTSSLTGNILSPLPQEGNTDTHSKTILGIIAAINAFEAAEKLTPHVPSDPLYTQMKRLLRSHYSCFLRCRHTKSHRGIASTFRRVLELRKHIQHVANLILDRNSSVEAMKAYEFAAQSKNVASISRRIERAFSPNSTVLNVSSLSPAEALNHSQFWTERWGQTYQLPRDRVTALDNFLSTASQASPPPLETPSPRFTAFSITHRPDGTPWLTSIEEIDKAIRHLANNKAPGISGLPVDFFKLTQSFHQDLAFIFNDIICNHVTPHAFSACRLVLLFKAGLTSDPKNYRPINLTDTTFRIFESVIRARLHAWSETTLHHDQYGFRKAQSTMSALLVIITSLHAAIASRKPMTLCFLDAVKAFDRVPHKAILESLMNHGLCPDSCRLIQSVISNHVSCVIDPCNPAQSIRIAVECGVLQGGILSPFFFSCFADSFFEHLALHSEQVLYADDRTFLDEDPARLQESLSALEHWASTRNLLHGGNEYICVNTAAAFTLTLHGETIPRVTTAKCLGINISENGNIDRPKVIQKASFAAIKISATWRRVSDKIPFSMLRDLICRYLLPTTIYGSAFFTDDLGPSLDKFLFQIMRKALHAHPSTNNLSMIELTGIIRPTVRIQQEIASVLCRMLRNTSPSVRKSIVTQFDLNLPFAAKTLKLFSLVSRFPICGPSLTCRLMTILDRIRLNAPDPDPTAPVLQPDPYVPRPPSNTHLLAFTDGSTSEAKQSGCAVICLIGGIVRSSSFYLPGITENNAAELSAINLLIDIASEFKRSDFPDLSEITVITDSLNCVSATHGISLVKEPTFISLLHNIQNKLAANNFKLFTKWVKAHDDTNASPYNQLADEWACKSIPTKQTFTVTTPTQAHNITQATLPLPWNASEIPPQDQTSTLQTIASNSILMHEDAHYRRSLSRYIPSNFSNFPGSGSTALQTSTIAGAHCLLRLRRDPAQHYADHPDLQHLREYWYRGPCPWCQDPGLPTNFHLLHECPLTRATTIDRRKIVQSRRAIFAGAISTDWPTRAAMDEHLTFLTSSSYLPGNNVEHANIVVKHQARIERLYHKWRVVRDLPQNNTDPFDIPDDLPPDDAASENGAGDARPSNTKYHTSPEARQVILDRLEDCRSAAEFDRCVEFYGKPVNRISLWAHRSERAFLRPNYFRQWLGRIEAYLTLVNCPTHQIRHYAYTQHQARTDRAFHKTIAALPERAAPPGATHIHFALQGWIPKMTKIKKLLCRSLIRYTPANPSDPTRPARPGHPSTSTRKGLQAAHHRTVASPPWVFSLNWSLLQSTPLVEAWLAAPTSTQQRSLIGAAWPSDWPTHTIIQTRNKTDPALYQRSVISISVKGRSLLFLFDLIREALVSGELTTDPPFPRFTAAVEAKQAQGTRHTFAAFESAAVALIFTPIEIWRRQGRSFFINPINVTMKADLPATIARFSPRLEVYTKLLPSLQTNASAAVCTALAAEWARDQMEANRRYPRDFFPPLPADVPGSSTTSSSSSVGSWMLDGEADIDSSDFSDTD
jgi:hypothetical protein